LSRAAVTYILGTRAKKNGRGPHYSNIFYLCIIHNNLSSTVPFLGTRAKKMVEGHIMVTFFTYVSIIIACRQQCQFWVRGQKKKMVAGHIMVTFFYLFYLCFNHNSLSSTVLILGTRAKKKMVAGHIMVHIFYLFYLCINHNSLSSTVPIVGP